MAEGDSGVSRRLGYLPEKQQMLAEEVRQDLGLEEEFERELKKWFDDSVVERYRQSMLPCIRKGKPDADLTLMAFTLCKNDSLRGKWEKEEVKPSLEAFFLAFAAFDVEVKDADLPRGRVAVCAGVVQTMRAINERVLGDDSGSPTREEFECAFVSCAFPERLRSLQAGGRNREKAAKAIRKDVAYQTKTHCRLSADEISEINGKWTVPWIIFQTLIPYDWKF